MATRYHLPKRRTPSDGVDNGNERRRQTVEDEKRKKSSHTVNFNPVESAPSMLKRKMPITTAVNCILSYDVDKKGSTGQMTEKKMDQRDGSESHAPHSLS